MSDSGLLPIPAGLQRIRVFRPSLDGAGIVGPTQLFDRGIVTKLAEEAFALRKDGRFTREAPPRCRALHHRSTVVRDLIAKAGIAEKLSAMAREKLAIHPSMHFGCSFNWTTQCAHGDADSWHLDAAPYTAVVMLSEPETHFTGGRLSLFLGEPSDLWPAAQNNQPLPARAVLDIPFRKAGEVVLFQGRHIPHRVTSVFPGTTAADSTSISGRLSLAIGLYSVEEPNRWIFPGEPIDEQLMTLCWRNEDVKARVLTASEDLRALTAWPSTSTEQEGYLQEAARKLNESSLGLTHIEADCTRFGQTVHIERRLS